MAQCTYASHSLSPRCRVPISLVYRTDLAKLDGSDPLLLDAYGRCAHTAIHCCAEHCRSTARGTQRCTNNSAVTRPPSPLHALQL